MKKTLFCIMAISITLASCSGWVYLGDDTSSQPKETKKEYATLNKTINQLREEIKGEGETISKEIHQLRDDIDKQKETIEKQREDIEKLREDVKNQTERASSTKVYKDTIRILKKENATLHSRLEKMEKQHQQELAARDATIDSLQRIANQIHANGFIDRQKLAPSFYCRAILESPLMVKYDKENVDYALEMAKLMGYDNKKNDLYEVYYLTYADLLKNYESYYKEFLGIVNETVKQFDYPSHRNRDEMLKQFNNKVGRMAYYKVRGTGNHKEYKHIYYLDFQIEQIRGLFTPAQYNRKNFEDLQKILQIKQ